MIRVRYIAILTLLFQINFGMETSEIHTQKKELVLPSEIVSNIAQHLIKQEKNPELAVQSLYRFFSVNKDLRDLFRWNKELNGQLVQCLYVQHGDDLCFMAALLNTPAADHWFAKQALQQSDCIQTEQQLGKEIGKYTGDTYFTDMNKIRTTINRYQASPQLLRDGLGSLITTNVLNKLLRHLNYPEAEHHTQVLFNSAQTHTNRQNTGIKKTAYHCIGYLLCKKRGFSFKLGVGGHRDTFIKENIPAFDIFLCNNDTKDYPETSLRAALENYYDPHQIPSFVHQPQTRQSQCRTTLGFLASITVPLPPRPSSIENAMLSNNLTGLKMMLKEYNVNPNVTIDDHPNKTVLHKAIEVAQLEVVKLLYIYGGTTQNISPLALAQQMEQDDNNPETLEIRKKTTQFLLEQTT